MLNYDDPDARFNGVRIPGSVDRFIYENEKFRPTWTRGRGYRLTEEHRRQLCVHLAAHAAVSSIGGLNVYMLAVACTGVRSWTIGDRKCDSFGKMWGLCSTSDFFVCNRCWDNVRQEFVADRKAWEAEIDRCYEQYCREVAKPIFTKVLKVPEQLREEPPLSRDQYFEIRRRQARAHMCACLAGHIADGITAGMSAEDALKLYEREGMPGAEAGDIAVAKMLADLLPAGEYEHAILLTEEALRRPEIWRPVQRVAGELETFGLLEGSPCEADVLNLPTDENWPPAPGFTP